MVSTMLCFLIALEQMKESTVVFHGTSLLCCCLLAVLVQCGSQPLVNCQMTCLVLSQWLAGGSTSSFFTADKQLALHGPTFCSARGLQPQGPASHILVALHSICIDATGLFPGKPETFAYSNFSTHSYLLWPSYRFVVLLSLSQWFQALRGSFVSP